MSVRPAMFSITRAWMRPWLDSHHVDIAPRGPSTMRGMRTWGLRSATRSRRGILHLDLGLAEDGVAELEHSEGLGGAPGEDAEVLVLLAAERLHVDLDAERVGEQTLHLVVGERRGGQVDLAEVVEDGGRSGLGHGVFLG